MVYPENPGNVDFITQAVAAEVALYPAHTVTVLPRYERNPFVGVAEIAHGDAHVIQLNSHYIGYPPVLKGLPVSDEATLMALEGAKESRMALAHLDVALGGGENGPAYDYFFRLYQNNQSPLTLDRYRPEDLLYWVLFGTAPLNIKTRIDRTLRKDDNFLSGVQLSDLSALKAKLATHSALDSDQVIIGNQTLRFLGDFPVVPTGRYTQHDQEMERSIGYLYQGVLSANLSAAEQVTWRSSKWDLRLDNLIRSIYRAPWFWAYYYSRATS